MYRIDQFKTYREKDETLCKQLKDKDFQLKELENIFRFNDYLGYDMTGEFIYPIVNYREGSFSWLSTVDGTYQTTSFTIQEGKRIAYNDIKSYDVLDHLLKHTHPLECKNPRIKLDNYGYAIPNNLKYIDKDMCGALQKKSSDRLIIDLDCHSSDSKEQHKIFCEAQQFITYLKNNKCTPTLIEKSREGSYHFYIKLDSIYSWNEKLEFIKYYNDKYKGHLELKERIRFPYSYQYQAITINEEVLSVIESREQAYQNNSCFIIKEKIKQETIIESIITPEIKEIKKSNVVKIRSSIFERESKAQIKHITLQDFINNSSIQIGRGTRHEGMLKLVQIAKFSGLTEDDVLLAIRSNDSGSKDLQKWTDIQLYSVIKKMYDKCTNYFIETSETCYADKFISNRHLIPENIKEVIENKFIISKVISNCQAKDSKRNHIIYKIIISEMMGSLYYNCLNPKRVREGQSTKYLKGSQFSEAFGIKMREHYSELSNTDVYAIINLILKQSKIFNQYMYCTRGWIYSPLIKEGNSCRLFNLSSNVDKSIITNSNILSINILKSLLNLLTIITYNNNLLYRIFFKNIKLIIDTLEIETEYLIDVG